MHGPFAERSLRDVHGDWAERLVMIRAGLVKDAWLSYSNPDLLNALHSDRMQAPKVSCRSWGLAAMYGYSIETGSAEAVFEIVAKSFFCD